MNRKRLPRFPKRESPVERNKTYQDVIFEYDDADGCGMIKLKMFFDLHAHECEKIPAKAYRILFSKLKIKQERVNHLVEQNVIAIRTLLDNRFKDEYGFDYT